MTRVTLPYLHVVSVKRRRYAYYRRAGQRVAIADAAGQRVAFTQPPSPEWLAAYQRIHASFEAADRSAAAPGSLGALIAAYLAAPEYTGLTAKTRRDYRRYLDLLSTEHGALAVWSINRAWVLALRDAHAATPRKANYLVQVLRLLMTFAVDRGWRSDNPALRPRQLKTGPGHRPWEEIEIARFREQWPAEMVQRVAFELMLNTGQRGGDVVRLLRSQYRDGWLLFRQAKAGAVVDIPAAVDLRTVLEPWLAGHDAAVVLVTETGRPFRVDHFRHTMRAAYQAAGLPPSCTSHGLRYTAATRLRELGCDWETIGAITGHQTAAMARKYSQQRRKARRGMSRLQTGGDLSGS